MKCSRPSRTKQRFGNFGHRPAYSCAKLFRTISYPRFHIFGLTKLDIHSAKQVGPRHGSLGDFQGLLNAIRSFNGAKVARLLSLDNEAQRLAVRQGSSPNGTLPESALRYIHTRTCGLVHDCKEHWAVVLRSHYLCLAALLSNNHDQAFLHMADYISDMNSIFREENGAWMVPVVTQTAEALRLLANKADEQLLSQRQHQCRKEAAGSWLQKFYSTAKTLKGNQNKSMALLPVVNTMFKLYFKLNTLRNCKPCIQAVEHPNFSFTSFPQSERVTYKYFAGRLAIFQDQLAKAEADLEYAFNHCPADAWHNKRLCLYFLVPVRLLAGSLPSEAHLAAFNLQIYIPFVQAMKSGSTQQLAAALKQHQVELIRKGVYLQLVKLQPIVMRRLLKRSWVINREGNEKGHLLPLGQLQKAIRWQQMDMDEDDVECAVANLIHKKYVKGYISHKNQVLVLSKADPFPAVSAQQI
ncbi:hypothetical protein WJX74_004036 [Apatococcus lobatus]|uniref:PCI domain-containing protein n=1 Tax=Apatococcus lobatus TaxID=904363 RepID=A0AAW1RBY6_9CHLO